MNEHTNYFSLNSYVRELVLLKDIFWEGLIRATLGHEFRTEWLHFTKIDTFDLWIFPDIET